MPHVLIVADDPDIASTLRHWAGDEGCTVTVTDQLKQAITLLRSQQPDWIFTTQELPDGRH